MGNSQANVSAMKTKENIHKLSSALGRRNSSKDYSPMRSLPTEIASQDDVKIGTSRPKYRIPGALPSSYSVSKQQQQPELSNLEGASKLTESSRPPAYHLLRKSSLDHYTTATVNNSTERQKETQGKGRQ